MPLSRRSFLSHCSACAAGAWLIGCSDSGSGGSIAPDTGVSPETAPDTVTDSGLGPDSGADSGTATDANDTDTVGPTCDEQLTGGVMEAVLAFDGVTLTLDERRGSGLDGRLYTDLKPVPEERLVDNARFYIRTMYPDLLDASAAWQISVEGLVERPQTLSLADLLDGPATPMGDHVLECSGNGRRGGFGLMSAASWTGVRVTDVLDRLSLRPEATQLLVEGFDGHSVPSAGGHSTPGASWVFSFEQLAETGAFFGTEMNGVPLPADHGAPVRLYVPGWYGCSCIKWVNRLELVDDMVASTGQMREFAGRTHQPGVPALARDFLPASMDQAAMPVRVERWRVDGEVIYRVLGVMWGGYALTDALVFEDGAGVSEPVDVCPPQTQNQLWTVWQHLWRPRATGQYALTLQIDDASVPTRRLDKGYYERLVTIDVAS